MDEYKRPQRRQVGRKRSAADHDESPGSLAKTTTPMSKHKITRACDVCKHQKKRCSGTVPCLNCVRRNIECRYMAPYNRGRPPTPLSATPDRDSVPNHATPRNSRSVHFQVEEDDSRQTATVTIPSRITSSQTSPEPGMTEIQGQYVDPTSGLAFLNRAQERFSNQPGTIDAGLGNHGPERLQRQMTAGDKPLEGSPDDDYLFPDRQMAAELVDFYFDVCIATYRFLHRPTVTSWLTTMHQNKEADLPLQQDIGENSVAIVMMVLAIAIFHQGKSRNTASSPEEQLSSYQSDRLFCASIALSDSATGYPQIESVQAKLVQVLYLLHTSRMNWAWYIFGDALRMIAAMGLHRRQRRSKNLSRSTSKPNYIQSQLQRRTFWVAYILDQYLGVIFGRPRHYHDSDIDQVFPDMVDDEDMRLKGPVPPSVPKDCCLSSLVYHAKLTQIVARITATVYPLKQLPADALVDTVQSLDAELKTWREELPPFLGLVNPSSLIAPYRRQATALKLGYSHAIMYATRPFLLENIDGRFPQSVIVKDLISDCLSAAGAALGIVDTMAQDGTLFHAFWWTHYVTFCALAVVYVWQLQRSVPEGIAEPSSGGLEKYDQLFKLAERCQGHLGQATWSNSPSRRYTIILQRLREEVKQHTAGQALRSLSRDPNNNTNDNGNGNDSGKESADIPNSPIQTSPPNIFAMTRHGDIGMNLPVQQTELQRPDGLSSHNFPTLDWLDIDSMAFESCAALEVSAETWLSDTPGLFF